MRLRFKIALKSIPIEDKVQIEGEVIVKALL